MAWNYPTSWDALTPWQRASNLYGDPTTFETIRDFQFSHAQPWIQQGLNTSIDQQTLSQLLAAYQANPSGLVSIGESDAGQMFGFDPSMTVGEYTIGPDGTIGKSLSRETWGQDVSALYGNDGNLIGIGSGDSTALGLAKFALASLAAYGGVNAADGLVNGATAASTGGSGALGGSEAFGAGLGEGATLTGGSTLTGGTPVFGTTLADAGIGFGGMGAYAPVAGAVGGAAAGGGGGGAAGGGGATSGAGGSLVSSLVNGAKDVMGSNTGSLIGAGLGAVAGAIDSQDKEQTQSREPWKAAQPFLQQLLGQGQQLSTQYQQQPFSQAQRTAYGNMGGLMDSINSQIPGLLGTFNANASGQNQFVRGAPRRLQGGGANFSGYMPGLLGNFGT